MVMDAPSLPWNQNQWYFCANCSGLFWANGAVNGVTCPAGGNHNGAGSPDYSLLVAS